MDPDSVNWRVQMGHCVQNPCTMAFDCHYHEVSLDEKSSRGYAGEEEEHITYMSKSSHIRT